MGLCADHAMFLQSMEIDTHEKKTETTACRIYTMPNYKHICKIEKLNHDGMIMCKTCTVNCKYI